MGKASLELWDLCLLHTVSQSVLPPSDNVHGLAHSSSPALLKTACTMHCFPFLSRLANQKSHSMASLKSSSTQVFSSATTEAQTRVLVSVCCFRIPQAKVQPFSTWQPPPASSQVITMTGTSDLLATTQSSWLHNWGPEHGQCPQCPPGYMRHSSAASAWLFHFTPTTCWVYQFAPRTLLLPDQICHQVVISCVSLFTRVQDIQPM